MVTNKKGNKKVNKKDKALATKQDIADISDPIKLLDLLKNAIIRKSVDRNQVSAAVRQVLHNYEAQNRIFLIGMANAELPRVVNLMSFLTECETELFKPERLENTSTRDLIRLYALSQSHLLASTDNIKKVTDMRLDLMRASGGDQISNLFDSDAEELNTLSDLPGLDSQGRDKVRKIVTGLIDTLDNDNTLVERDESDTDDTDY